MLAAPCSGTLAMSVTTGANIKPSTGKLAALPTWMDLASVPGASWAMLHAPGTISSGAVGYAKAGAVLAAPMLSVRAQTAPIRIGMPSGILTVAATVKRSDGGWHAEQGAFYRTQRRMFEGQVLEPIGHGLILWEDQFQFLARGLDDRRVGLGADADPVDAVGGV